MELMNSCIDAEINRKVSGWTAMSEGCLLDWLFDKWIGRLLHESVTPSRVALRSLCVVSSGDSRAMNHALSGLYRDLTGR